MSNFDPTAFLDATTTEAATKRPPLAQGRDFIAVIGEPKIRKAAGKKDPTKEYTFVDFPLDIDLTAYPDEMQRLGGVTKVSITDGGSLDFNDAGMLDWAPGKNGKLRRYREATDLNTPGQPFSIRMLQGRLVTVKIGHREYQGDIFDEAAAISAPVAKG